MGLSLVVAELVMQLSMVVVVEQSHAVFVADRVSALPPLPLGMIVGLLF